MHLDYYRESIKQTVERRRRERGFLGRLIDNAHRIFLDWKYRGTTGPKTAKSDLAESMRRAFRSAGIKYEIE